MQKWLAVTNLLTLALLIWVATSYWSLRGSIVVTDPCSCIQKPDLDKNGYNIRADEAKKMVTNYNDRWNVINANDVNSSACFQDSRCAWFSISRLKGFIKEIESQSCINLKDPCCDTLGIRIYFGEYDPGLIASFKNQYPAFNPGNKDFTYKTSLLMIPTYRTSNGIDRDFNPLFATNCNDGYNEKSFSGTMLALMMDHAGIIPPPWASSTCNNYKNSGADFLIHVVGLDVQNSGCPTPQCSDCDRNLCNP